MVGTSKRRLQSEEQAENSADHEVHTPDEHGQQDHQRDDHESRGLDLLAARPRDLLHLDANFAQAAGLKVGDYLTIGLLGVERQARIANLRRIDWESLGFNYVLVFSPNALEDAPHNLAATIELPAGSEAGGLLRSLVRGFPSSSVIEVGPLLTQARTILEQVSLAILAAASVAVLAGIAVLLGAIAAARAARIYDTVILRVLGASTRQLLMLQLTEFGLLAVLLALVALGLGGAGAWLVIVQLFEFEWRGERSGLGADQEFDAFYTSWLIARSVDRHTFVFSTDMGTTVDDLTRPEDFFSLGGFFNLSGLPPGYLSGPHYGIARLMYYRKIGRGGSGVLDLPAYVGLSLEAGNTWMRRDDISTGDLRKDGSLFFGVDTPLGPVYLAAGFDEGGGKQFYLFLGRTF